MRPDDVSDCDHPDGDTTWDHVAHRIVFHDRDLGDIRLSSGDLLMLDGYGLGTVDRPDNLEVTIGPWIGEPDASCPADRWVAEPVVPLELAAQQAPFCPSTAALSPSGPVGSPPSPSVAPSPGTVAGSSPPAVATGTSPGPSATPIPTLRRPASDAREAEQALRAYYRDLHLGHLKRAWRRLAPESRAAYGSYASFVDAHGRGKVDRIWPHGQYRDEICGWIAKSPFADVELWRSKLFSVADGPNGNDLVDCWVVAPDATGRWLLRL